MLSKLGSLEHRAQVNNPLKQNKSGYEVCFKNFL